MKEYSTYLKIIRISLLTEVDGWFSGKNTCCLGCDSDSKKRINASDND